jgi:hypothetical protein
MKSLKKYGWLLFEQPNTCCIMPVCTNCGRICWETIVEATAANGTPFVHVVNRA